MKLIYLGSEFITLSNCNIITRYVSQTAINLQGREISMKNMSNRENDRFRFSMSIRKARAVLRFDLSEKKNREQSIV